MTTEARPLRVLFLPNVQQAPRWRDFRPGEAPDPRREVALFRQRGIIQETRDLYDPPLNPWCRKQPFLAGFDPVRALRVLLFDRSYDAIVSVFESNVVFILLLRRLFRFTTPILLWEVSAQGWRPRDLVRRFVVPRVEKVLVLTRHQKEHVARTFRPKAPPDIIGFCVDETFFHPDFARAGSYVLSVGDDVGRDYPTLVAAWQGLDLELVLKTRWRPAAALPIRLLSERLSFVALRELYADASMVVLPLKATDHPTGITALFEAMAMGKPVIATDIGTTRDYIVHGETGLLVPPGDAQALRQAILDLHDAPAERRRLGENARRRIDQAFSMPAFIDRFAASIRATTAVLLAAVLLAAPAQAASLTVGPGRAFSTPGAAAQAAQDGDTIAIDPGEYYDCAILNRDHLTIAGTGPITGAGVVITDTTCQNKALFIVRGNDTTIRNITFTRARVADNNGAGIRMEGRDLTVESSRFINNQTGLLDGGQPGSTVRVIDCDFTDNGVRDIGPPSPALSVGAIATLHVERSRFADSHGGAHILSGAGRTELIGNRIEDGKDGVRDALVVLTDGGSLVMADNLLRRAPGAMRANAAVHAYPGPAGTLELRRNTLVNASGRPAALLLDWSRGTADFAGNVLDRGDVERSTEGFWRHQAITAASDLYANARHLAGAELRALQSMSR